MKTLYESREELNKISNEDLKKLFITKDYEHTGKIRIVTEYIDEDEETYDDTIFGRNEKVIDKLDEYIDEIVSMF